MNSWKSLFLLLLAFVLFLFLPKLQFVELDHGDEFTDANVLVSGANFARQGFVKCRFLPYFEVNSDLSEKAYTTFPPFAENVNGILRSFLHLESLVSFRVFSLICSFFTIVFWYLAIQQFVPTKSLGFIFALLLMANPMFVYAADSLNQSCFSETGRALFFFLFIAGPGVAFLKKHLSFILWGAFFLNSLISLEYVPWLAVFMAAFSVLLPGHPSSLSWKSILFLCSAPVVSFSLRMVQNAWYFGSFSAAIQNTLDAAGRRMLASTDSPFTLSFHSWWNEVVLNNLQQVQVVGWEVWFFAGGLILLMALSLSPETQTEVQRMARLAGSFLVAGVTWYLVMPSHSLAHSQVLFLARHVIPLAVVGFAIFLQVCLAFAEEKQVPQKMARILMVCWVLTLFFLGLNASQHPFNREYRLRAHDFSLFSEYLRTLQGQIPTGESLGVNYWRHPMISYYTQAKIVKAFDGESFQALPAKPAFFLLFPYQGVATQQLAQILKESYTPVSKSPAAGFPTFLLKRSDVPERGK